MTRLIRFYFLQYLVTAQKWERPGRVVAGELGFADGFDLLRLEPVEKLVSVFLHLAFSVETLLSGLMTTRTAKRHD